MFLAVHLGLEEYRAVKRVRKRDVDYERFRGEALILKEYRHPGIPIVYDLEENDEYSYLIEEYLEGESLRDLVTRQGHLSEAKLIRYGIQICSIVNHLHSAGTHPILYLDLQPKNLLLCRDQVKLVDFDHAASMPEANMARKRYGTAGCAAPEQYTDEPLDQRTDIYAIGAILYYLGTGHEPEPDPEFPEHMQNCKLAVIIRRCLCRDKAGRFESAVEVLKELERLERGNTGVFNNPLSSLNIALTGSKSGVGTTHLAIGLSVYLKAHGYPNLYQERNRTGAVRAWMAYHQRQVDLNGLVHIRDCVMRPFYGENIRLREKPYPANLYDYGTDWCAVRDEGCPQLIILVCGGKWWELSVCLEALSVLGDSGELRLVFLPGCREAGVRLPVELKAVSCYQMPFFPDPFKRTSETEEFFGELLRGVVDKKGVSYRENQEKRVRDIWKRIAGPSE